MPSNLMPLFRRSFRNSMRVMWRVTRELFHEATGALFGVFAVYGAYAAWRQWRTRTMLWMIGAAVAYTLMMAIFAFGSFRRARRVR